MGHDLLRSGGGSPTYQDLLVEKPPNERDGGPAHRDQPSNCGDASHSHPCPLPLGPKPPPAGWDLTRQFRFRVHTGRAIVRRSTVARVYKTPQRKSLVKLDVNAAGYCWNRNKAVIDRAPASAFPNEYLCERDQTPVRRCD